MAKVTKTAQSQSVGEVVSRRASTPGPRHVHVLVIEDHEDTRAVLDVLLRTEGYDVTLASDGQDGLDRYRERPAGIVLVDIFMPRKNGIETIRELVREDRAAVCIAMSADGDPLRRSALELAVEAGARLTLRKPIEPWVLLRTLEGGQRIRKRLTS